MYWAINEAFSNIEIMVEAKKKKKVHTGTFRGKGQSNTSIRTSNTPTQLRFKL